MASKNSGSGISKYDSRGGGYKETLEISKSTKPRPAASKKVTGASGKKKTGY